MGKQYLILNKKYSQKLSKPLDKVESDPIITRYSVLGTRYSVLGTRYSVLGTRYSVLVHRL